MHILLPKFFYIKDENIQEKLQNDKHKSYNLLKFTFYFPFNEISMKLKSIEYHYYWIRCRAVEVCCM